MPLGFCPPLIAHLRAVAECNTPSSKITPVGFLKMLWENRPNADIINRESALRLDDGQGHIRDLVLKYLKRTVPGQSATSDSCDITYVQDYQEVTIATTNYRRHSIYISDEDLARYCAEATNMVRINGFPTPFMNEFLERIRIAANGLLGDIDTDLLTAQVTKFGANAANGGSTAAVSVNFPGANAGVDNFYTEGMTKILQDASINEMCGDLLVVGHGNFNAFTLQQLVACCSQLGIDASRWTGFRYYPDLYSQTIWGANHIGVFSSGSVGLIELNRYEGWRAGTRGSSEFFTMSLPIDCPECNSAPDSMEFDVQLQYVDCPTVMNIGCVGEQTVPRGYIMHIGKAFGLFNIPTDSYQNEAYDDCYNDRLTGNNGSLRYVITNA